mgnify:CR=1 FL=1
MESFWLLTTDHSWIHCFGDDKSIRRLSSHAQDNINMVFDDCDIDDTFHTIIDINCLSGLAKLENLLVPNVISFDSAERFCNQKTKTLRQHKKI